MLPLYDDNRLRRTFPFITIGLIGLNIIMFLMELLAGERFIIAWSFVPARFIANPIGESITLFSSIFMHAGWLHLLGNMLYLGIFGDNVEDRMGHFKYLIFYLICGIAASFTQFAFSMSSDIPMLGASGAIAGVLGAYLLLFPQGNVYMLFFRFITPVPAWVALGVWIVIQLISGAGSLLGAGQMGGVAYLAHVGGFFAGIFFTLPFSKRIHY